MFKKTSTAVKAAILAVVVVCFGAASYAGYKYFNAHYIVLNEQEVDALMLNIVQAQMEAFAAGKQVCRSTT